MPKKNLKALSSSPALALPRFDAHFYFSVSLLAIAPSFQCCKHRANDLPNSHSHHDCRTVLLYTQRNSPPVRYFRNVFRLIKSQWISLINPSPLCFPFKIDCQFSNSSANVSKSVRKTLDMSPSTPLASPFQRCSSRLSPRNNHSIVREYCVSFPIPFDIVSTGDLTHVDPIYGSKIHPRRR